MRKWNVFLLAASLQLSACATLPPVLPPQLPTPEYLLERVGARLQPLQGLKGLAQVKVSSIGRKFQAQEVLIVHRPAFLRVESLGPLGTPQLYLVSDGHELSLYIPGENRYYRGQATVRHLSSVLPVALEPEEVVAFLLGGVPLTDYDRSSVRADREENLWILDLISTSRGVRQSLWIHPQSYQILRAEFQGPGSSHRLAFADFQQVQGLLFPKRIYFTSLESRAQISVEYQDVELNPDWKREDFHLPVPREAEVLPLE
jgi:outer membrane lipoprotein-sorting protein